MGSASSHWGLLPWIVLDFLPLVCTPDDLCFPFGLLPRILSGSPFYLIFFFFHCAVNKFEPWRVLQLGQILLLWRITTQVSFFAIKIVSYHPRRSFFSNYCTLFLQMFRDFSTLVHYNIFDARIPKKVASYYTPSVAYISLESVHICIYIWGNVDLWIQISFRQVEDF